MQKSNGWLKAISAKPWVPYVLPFFIFLLLTEIAGFFPPGTSAYLYIAKTVIAGALLYNWRDRFKADLSSGLSLGEGLVAIACGLLVLAIWIIPENYLFQISKDSGFDPYALGKSQVAFMGLVSVRIIGSSMVVPIMEELFWRSFLMRYLINPDFRSVPMGAFSWFSFIGVTVLFGFEHHRVIVGVIAGVLYGVLLIRQKKLLGVILAHTVTNLCLGIYVVMSGYWTFW